MDTMGVDLGSCIVCRLSPEGVVTEQFPPASQTEGAPDLVGRDLASWIDPPATVWSAMDEALASGRPVIREWTEPGSAGSPAGYWSGQFTASDTDDLMVVLRDVTVDRCREDAEHLIGLIEERVAEPTPSTGTVIEWSLRDVTEFIGARGVTAVKLDQDTAEFSRVYEWSPDPRPSDGAFPVASPEERARLVESVALLKRPIVLRADEVPEEAVVLRWLVDERGLAAVGLMPMMRGDVSVGVMIFGFATLPDRVTGLRFDALGGLGRLLWAISERDERMAQELASAARLESLMSHSKELVALISAKGRVLYMSPTAAERVGYETDGASSDQHPLQPVSEPDRTVVIEAFTKSLACPSAEVPVYFQAASPDGTSYLVDGTFTNLLDVPGVDAIVFNARDVSLQQATTEALQRRAELDTLAAEISRELLSATPSEMRAAILTALARVARHLGADAATLGRREPDGWFRRSYSWYEPSVGPLPSGAPDRLPPDAFPWAFTAVDEGRAGVLHHIDDLPDEASLERQMLGLIGAKSAALVAIHAAGDITGYITLYWRTEAAEDDATILAPLRVIGDVLAAGVDRALAEQGRDDTDALVRSVYDALGEAVIVTGTDGRVVDANRAAAELFGAPVEALIGREPWWSGIRPSTTDDAARARVDVLEAVETALGPRLLVVNTRPILTGPDDLSLGMVVSFADVTEKIDAADLKSRLAAIVESSFDSIFSTNGDGEIMSWNHGAEELFGYTASEVIGRDFSLLASPRHRAESVALLERVKRGETVRQADSTRTRRDGSLVHVATTLSPVRDPEGSITGIASIARDITKDRAAEHDQRRSDARFRSLIEHAADGIIVFAPNGLVEFASPSVEAIYGRSPAELIGTPGMELIHHADVAAAEAMTGRLLGNERTGNIEGRARRPDGSWCWVEATVTNLLDDELVNAIVMNVRDVTERKQFEHDLEHQALHDSLTGLPNRALLVDRLEHALVRAETRGPTLGVLFLDLDHFKFVNDSRGHSHGDHLLKLVAERLRDAVRPADTVARFGGDEFVILVEDDASPPALLALAERVRAALRSPFIIEATETFVTVSIGIATPAVGLRDPDALLRDADAAMYRAKEEGRDRYEVFDPSIHATAVEHLETTDALRRALEHHEFELYYQPVRNTRSGTLVAFEALLRWHKPDGTLVAPTDFISIAEETGLIVPIGAWVIDEACRQAAIWQRAAGGSGPRMAINMSVRQLRDPTVTQTLEDALHHHGLSSNTLIVEITESVFADDVIEADQTLAAIHALGIDLVIDDFGTGYSSLAYLKRLPVQGLKIDQGFVAGLGTSAPDTAIVTAITDLARGLGLRVVAEGVETLAQLVELGAMDCEFVQGYHLGYPSPAATWDDEVAAFGSS